MSKIEIDYARYEQMTEDFDRMQKDIVALKKRIDELIQENQDLKGRIDDVKETGLVERIFHWEAVLESLNKDKTKNL